MSAADALKMARDAGVHVSIDGDDRALEAEVPPPAMRNLLSRHKCGIVAHRCSGRDGWSAEEWFTFFNKRAAGAEFEGGLPARQAEARAGRPRTCDSIGHRAL